jgi:glycosyltransferase involved in cell wall biosynthesis
VNTLTFVGTPRAYAPGNVGFVIIGRNEGARLATCISSTLKETHLVVYVDSGSVDGSVDIANRYGVGVVELDPTLAFTAARARNTGVEWLRSHFPFLSYIHFVDGDCELVSGWLPAALAAMQAERDLGVVC